MGDVEVDETIFQHSHSVASGRDGTTTTIGKSWDTKRQVRRVINSTDFDANLKRASPEDGFMALNKVPCVGTYVSAAPWEWVVNKMPRPGDYESQEKFRSEDNQKLKDWNEADLIRLKLPLDLLAQERRALDLTTNPMEEDLKQAKKKKNDEYLRK